MKQSCHLFLSTALAVIMTTALSHSALADGHEVAHEKEPAVSGLNGKISAFGGGVGSDVIDDSGLAGITGAISLPIGHRYGLQIDGMAGTLDGDAFGGIAAHAFYRDPDAFLLGLYTSYTALDIGAKDSVGRFGLEGELYLDNLTLTGIAGVQYGELDDGFTSTLRAAYYLTDDLMLSAGHNYYEEAGHFGTAGVEYQMPFDLQFSPSLFADGRFGEDDFYSVTGGIRFYFGEEKSLIDRHRQDDPDIFLPDDLFAILGGQDAAPESAGCPPGTILVDGVCITVGVVPD